jgi:DNA-binding transcriptional regulator YiaG
MKECPEPVALASLYRDLTAGRPRRIRERAGLAQSDLAHAIGASRSTVASWEERRRKPRGALAARYIALLESLAPFADDPPARDGR